MRTIDLIIKKREGGILEKNELEYLVQSYVNGDTPDYQMAAFCMAVYFQGMTDAETAALTTSMTFSGEVIDLSSIPGLKVDKHSTGGVGDTTTLVLAPLIAAAGVPMAKMSGRGLGFTGGTIDKLESIPGFRAALTKEEFIAQVSRIGLAVVGQTGNIVPADKKLYALRDVTGTVESVPLIASSIMSKKIAAGADAIVLDVKVGKGAFMKSIDEAVFLSRVMVSIGEKMGKKVVAVVSDMNEPLGMAMGNSLEVEAAILVLRGEAGGRIRELSLALGIEILLLAKAAQTRAAAEKMLEELLSSGQALKKFAEMIQAQGGNPDVTDDLSLLPQAAHKLEVRASRAGYFQVKDAGLFGQAAMLLGAGREKKDSVIDLLVGIKLAVKNGTKVVQGQLLMTIFYNEEEKMKKAVGVLQEAYTIKTTPVSNKPLIYEIIS